jgi:hypothetical protein
MLNCRQVSRLISQSMDARLPWHRRLGIRVHLFYCVWCRRYAAQLKVLRQAACQLRPEATSPESQKLSEDAKQRMQARLEAALKDTPPH